MRKQVYLYLYVPMKAASISVIIPNYNGKNLLQNNLPSVFAALEHAARFQDIFGRDNFFLELHGLVLRAAKIKFERVSKLLYLAMCLTW